MIETYKDIPSFEGHYQASNLGNIKSIKKINGHVVLSPKIDAYGYCEVGLWVKGKVLYRKVHKLVAQTFLENPDNKPQVNHKNFIRTDNKLSNLEWATPQEDADHRAKNNRFIKGDKHYAYGKYGANSKTAKLVLDIQTGIFYDCVKEAADAKNEKYKTLVGKLSGNDNNNTSLRYV
jgi:hypothetical protein